VLPEWARDILIGWAPEGVAAVFGLGDDHIGSVPPVMFDFNPGLENWTTPPRIGLHRKTLQHDHNRRWRRRTGTPKRALTPPASLRISRATAMDFCRAFGPNRRKG